MLMEHVSALMSPCMLLTMHVQACNWIVFVFLEFHVLRVERVVYDLALVFLDDT